jgi:two-component system, response regulator PdtaR
MTGPPAPHLPVVLIVDDEPLLRMLAVEAVEDAGFISLQAADADEALVLLETNPDVTLLLTDINMPGSMDGLALAHAVQKRWPAIKILVVSGQVKLLSSDLPPNSRFLGKPYHADAMVAGLRLLVAAHA